MQSTATWFVVETPNNFTKFLATFTIKGRRPYPTFFSVDFRVKKSDSVWLMGF